MNPGHQGEQVVIYPFENCDNVNGMHHKYVFVGDRRVACVVGNPRLDSEPDKGSVPADTPNHDVQQIPYLRIGEAWPVEGIW